MRRTPVSVGAARQVAAKRLADKMGLWAGQVARPAEPGQAVVRIVLHPPSEKQMLRDQHAVEEWIRQWRDVAGRPWAQVDWAVRSWKSVGRQEVPVRLHLQTPGDVAAFVGGKHREGWERLSGRARALAENFPEAAASTASGVDNPALAAAGPATPNTGEGEVSTGTRSGTSALGGAIQANSKMLLDLSDLDFTRLLAVAEWILGNPTAGLRPRQLPVRGVDTKWFKDHKKLVGDVTAAGGKSELGIVEADRLLRLRILDTTLAPGGLSDFSAPVEQLEGLSIRPRTVFIFENLESVLAMPPWPNAVAIHGSGYAVRAVAQIPWIGDPLVKVIYWGDLDSDGFAILHALRRHLPHAESVLMDSGTLSEFSDLWVAEKRTNTGTFPLLHHSEREALEKIRLEGGVRLEQERIPWGYALERLQAASSEMAPGVH